MKGCAVAENALAVANFFIEKSAESQKELTPMQLLKLVYIAHGWHLGLTKEPLIQEDVEAWQYGPVIRPIYRRYKGYGRDPINKTDLAPREELSDVPRLKPFLDSIWKIYSDYTGPQLSTMTHTPDTPWYQIWHHQGGKNELGAVIPNGLIQAHYEAKSTS